MVNAGMVNGRLLFFTCRILQIFPRFGSISATPQNPFKYNRNFQINLKVQLTSR